MAEIRPGIAKADLAVILANQRETERQAFAASTIKEADFIDFVDAFTTAGGTLFVDGKPVAAAGIAEKWQGVGFVWLASSVDLQPYAKMVVRSVKQNIADAKQPLLMTTIHPDNAVARAWIEHLGFSELKNYDGSNMLLYTKRKQ